MLSETTYMTLSLIISFCVAIMKSIELVIKVKKYLKDNKK